MEERGEERERRWAATASLQPTYAQEPKKFVKGIGGPCINSEELNY